MVLLPTAVVMRLLADPGADPRIVHRSEYMTGGATKNMSRRRRKRMGRPPQRDREVLTLEAVKVAIELGADINTANTDGRTALDAAQALAYESVVDFLVSKGARRR